MRIFYWWTASISWCNSRFIVEMCMLWKRSSWDQMPIFNSEWHPFSRKSPLSRDEWRFREVEGKPCLLRSNSRTIGYHETKLVLFLCLNSEGTVYRKIDFNQADWFVCLCLYSSNVEFRCKRCALTLNYCYLVLPRGLYKLHKAAHSRKIESMLFSNDIGNSFLINRKVFKRLIACST